MTLSQRVEEAEERVTGMENQLKNVEDKLNRQEDTLTRVVAAAVKAAMEEERKKVDEVLAATASKLEDRLGRFRMDAEIQATIDRERLEKLREEAEESAKFREEMRAALVNRPGARPPPMVNLDAEASQVHGENEGPSPFRGDNRMPEWRRRDPRGWQEEGGGDGERWKHRKLEIPTFEGRDPDNWVMRARMFFDLYKLSEEDRVTAAVVAMDGAALQWFHWENKRRPFRGWLDLKDRLLREFRPSNAGSLHEQWLAVTQSTTVEEYQLKFIELAFPLEDVPESLMLGQFVNGLKGEIKAELRLLNPLTLKRAMDLAGRIEERNRVSGEEEGAWNHVELGRATLGQPKRILRAVRVGD